MTINTAGYLQNDSQDFYVRRHCHDGRVLTSTCLGTFLKHHSKTLPAIILLKLIAYLSAHFMQTLRFSCLIPIYITHTLKLKSNYV